MASLPKAKRAQLPARRTVLSPEDQKILEDAASLLGCAQNLGAILQAIVLRSEELQALRAQMGLERRTGALRYINELVQAAIHLREATRLEDIITQALSSIPFRKATLAVVIARTAASYRTDEYEAKLLATEKRDADHYRRLGPLVEVHQLDEPKSVVLDKNTGSSMVAAIRGLVPAKRDEA